MSRLPCFTVLLVATLLLAAPALALPGVGQPFPDTAIAAPDTQAGADYLGLPKAAKTFKVADVKSPYVLIQLFNAYCTHCMGEAPEMQRFFSQVTAGALKDKLKIMAVGMGNTPFEVKLFREKYKLTMPMSTDQEYVMHGLMGNPGTPSYVLVKNAGGKSTVVYSLEGRFNSAGEFIELLQSKMKEK